MIRLKTIRDLDDPRHQTRMTTSRKLANWFAKIVVECSSSWLSLKNEQRKMKESICQILHELFNTLKFAEKMVPKLLTREQMESRINICVDLLNNTVVNHYFYLRSGNKAPIDVSKEPKLTMATKLNWVHGHDDCFFFIYKCGIIYVY